MNFSKARNVVRDMDFPFSYKKIPELDNIADRKKRRMAEKTLFWLAHDRLETWLALLFGVAILVIIYQATNYNVLGGVTGAIIAGYIYNKTIVLVLRRKLGKEFKEVIDMYMKC